MNRQQRRRSEREGKKGVQWDIIIPSVLAIVILLIFVGNYLFPNLNISTYAGAPARILRKLADRGIQRLSQDWSEIDAFSYGYLTDEAYYSVEKKAETWAFTDLEEEKTVEYATNNLPDFYIDIPEVLDKLTQAVHDKSFEIGAPQTIDNTNMIVIMKVSDNEDELQEQFMLIFDKEHNIDRIFRVTQEGEETSGYSFSHIYTPLPNPETTSEE